MSEERSKIYEQREEQKRRLAQVYEQQMSTVESKRELERMENHKFEQVARELELRKEQDRNKVGMN